MKNNSLIGSLNERIIFLLTKKYKEKNTQTENRERSKWPGKFVNNYNFT